MSKRAGRPQECRCRTSEAGGSCRGERGFALLLAMVIAILLTLIGLSLTSSSISEMKTSTEFEAHEKALVIADAGFSMVKNDLRGQPLTDLLATATVVPKYLNYTNPQAGSFAARNPIVPHEARNIDFAAPPSPIGTRSVSAFMTPLRGAVVGTGRYFASLTDNSDETLAGLMEDPTADIDFTVHMRVLGLHPINASDRTAVGSARKNAIAILEGTVRRDLTFDLSSPLTLQGPDVTATFSGNAFDIVGDADHPAIGLMNDAPPNDAATAYASILDALGGKGTVTGKLGPDGESVMDVTDDVRGDPSPDAQNLFNPRYLLAFVNLIASFADTLYANDVHLSGGNIRLGTVDNPKITVALGNMNLSGGGSGAGILVVKGDFDLSGAFDFDGVVLVLGQGNLELSGANKTLTGGVFVARIEDDGAGNPVFGTATLSLNGNSNFVFSGGAIRLAISLLPMKTISLREITPELEPS